jgi:hypothetical protein
MATTTSDPKKRRGRGLSQPPTTAASTGTNPGGGARKGGGVTIPGSGVSIGGGRDRGGATTTQTGPRSFDLTLPPSHGMKETTKGWNDPPPGQAPDNIPGVGPGVETALQAGGDALSQIPGAIAGEAQQFQDYAQAQGGGAYGYGGAVGEGFKQFGQEVAGAAKTGFRPIGEGMDATYGFTRGLFGLTPPGQGDSSTVASGNGKESSKKGPAQDAVGTNGAQEQTLPSGESYYVNRDVDPDKYGSAIISGTREGATEGGFDAAMASGGYAPSSRALDAPPAGNEARLDAAEQALQRGNTGRANRLLSPEEQGAANKRRDMATLRRQANQQPSLSMPFDQFFQTAAERNAAQDQLRAAAEANATTEAARTKAAQSERESQRDFISDLYKARLDAQGGGDYELDKRSVMTEKGPQEEFVRFDPNTGNLARVEPKAQPAQEDLQGLRESLQKGPEAAAKAGQAFQAKFGSLPAWYVNFIKQQVGGQGTQSSAAG